VIDLSALWAGPLCAHLLHLCGADVIKVEAMDRPDGAREGNLPFYRLLNQGKRCMALDFHDPAGRRALCKVLERADIVIESSRPRALRQLGIEPEALLEHHPALTWVSITGYGRGEPQANWIGFGDDAGVAAGLSHVMRAATGTFQFAGDAIADPLTGILAALAAWRSWLAGGSRLLPLSLAGVASAGLAEELEHLGEAGVLQSFGAWWADVQGRALAPGRPRPVSDHVGALGEHTRTVLAELDISC
jgi:crotonobetainyl-CoA:carnitine CoA-transferase CaiB-like acyl-CoA transferase